MVYVTEPVFGVDGAVKVVRKNQLGEQGVEIAVMASPCGDPMKARDYVQELVDTANSALNR